MAVNAKLLVCIVGPTAIGKTSLAIELANFYKTDIISADSRQFFKELSIGTAKPSLSELNQAKHYFVDNLSIFDTYSVGDFEKEAIDKIDELFKLNNIVILVGGSGLYINAILNGFDDIPKANNEIRATINKDFTEKGLAYLQNELKKVDPDYYVQIDKKNPQRIIRALEIFQSTGKPFSQYRKKNIKIRNFKSLLIGLNDDREILYQRINKRVDGMIDQGLIEEVKSLSSYQKMNALKTVGYTEIFSFLNNQITLEKAIEMIKQNTRRFAKRQITWFNNQTAIKWFKPNEIDLIKKYISDNT